MLFPKGQVPPYAQPQITTFAVQEALIKTCKLTISIFIMKRKTSVLFIITNFEFVSLYLTHFIQI